MKHTIYCAGYDNPWGFQVTALADDGHVLAGHMCSNYTYAKHDIGITSAWQHEHYDAHFGAGNWELEWVDDPKTHPGWQAALALNHALHALETEAAK